MLAWLFCRKGHRFREVKYYGYMDAYAARKYGYDNFMGYVGVNVAGTRKQCSRCGIERGDLTKHLTFGNGISSVGMPSSDMRKFRNGEIMWEERE